MRAPRLGILAAGLAVAAGACGDDTPAPGAEAQVRAALGAYVRAVAAKDYDALCDRVLAPELLAVLRRDEPSCELALQRGLEDVRRPSLVVRSVRVRPGGATADAVVRTRAAGQPPSDDAVRLVRREDGWRVVALASPGRRRGTGAGAR